MAGWLHHRGHRLEAGYQLKAGRDMLRVCATGKHEYPKGCYVKVTLFLQSRKRIGKLLRIVSAGHKLGKPIFNRCVNLGVVFHISRP